MHIERNNVTVIFPFYNEMTSIPFFTKNMECYFEEVNKQVTEVILVNDGSSDETLNALKEISEKWKGTYSVEVQVLDVQPNQGKGNALKRGIELANGDWLLTLDADLATMPNQLDYWIDQKLVDLNKTDHIFIASRELGIKAGLVDFQWHRRIIGRIFALIVRLSSGLKLSDTQCGFKLYPRNAAKTAFANLIDRGFAHDVEILFRLQRKNYNIVSLPIEWTERGDSKVHLIKDSWNMFIQLMKLKKRVKKELKQPND